MPLIGRGNSLNGDNNTLTSDGGTTDNPMFKIKLRSLDGGYEQPNGSKEDTEENKKFSIGDVVSGQVLDNKNSTATGKIISIKKNEQQVLSFIEIIDFKSKEKIKLDPKSCNVKNTNDRYSGRDGQEGQQKVSYSAESLKHLISFDDFKLTNS